MSQSFSGGGQSEPGDGHIPPCPDPQGDQAFVHVLEPAQITPSDSASAFLNPAISDFNAREESFDIEEWFNFEKFDKNYGGGNDESEEASSGEPYSNIKVDTRSVDAAAAPGPDNLPDHTFASQTCSTAPFVDGHRSTFIPTEQTLHMPQSFQFSVGQAIAPRFLTIGFQQIAEQSYANAWMKSLTTQLDMLTCCMLATPDPRTASLRQCQVGATNLWTHLYHQKIHQLRGLQPTLRYRPLLGTVRGQLLHTLAVIYRVQRRPDPSANEIELALYQAQFHIELLRWEADEMSDLSRTCDHYRTRRIQQSGINCRVLDGVFFDLANIITFRFQATMSGAYFQTSYGAH